MIRVSGPGRARAAAGAANSHGPSHCQWQAQDDFRVGRGGLRLSCGIVE
jgi:hypothetical protein